MAKVTRFEDLEGWKCARVLSSMVYEQTRESVAFAKDFALKDQIRRAVISIMSNVAEGFERGSDKEFIYFLGVAKGSCGEVRSQLYVALDQQYIAQAKFDELKNQAETVSRLISGLQSYLKDTSYRGERAREESADYGTPDL